MITIAVIPFYCVILNIAGQVVTLMLMELRPMRRGHTADKED